MQEVILLSRKPKDGWKKVTDAELTKLHLALYDAKYVLTNKAVGSFRFYGVDCTIWSDEQWIYVNVTDADECLQIDKAKMMTYLDIPRSIIDRIVLALYEASAGISSNIDRVVDVVPAH